MSEAVTQTIGAAAFKAQCLDILERLGNGSLARVVVTKRGQPVAVLTPPPVDESRLPPLHGFMRGSVIIPSDVDLTEPPISDPFAAADGRLHD